MLYPDDVGFVSQSPEKLLRKMMGVIVDASAAFSLIVSETKLNMIRLRTNRVLESTAVFIVEAAGQVYNQTNEFVYLGGTFNHNNADLSIGVNRCIRNEGCSFRNYTLELYDRPIFLLEIKTRML